MPMHISCASYAHMFGPSLVFQLPAIKFVDRKKDIRLKSELPSMDEKDLEVQLTDRMLTISGEKKEKHEEGEEGKTATRVDQAVMNLLHEAETQVIRLIEERRVQVVQLVSRLEADETLDIGAIKSCLESDSTVTPFVKNRKRGTSLPPDTE